MPGPSMQIDEVQTRGLNDSHTLFERSGSHAGAGDGAGCSRLSSEPAKMITWESIFPTPIMRSNIGRRFTDGELKFIRKMQAAPHANFANARSADTHVLDAPEMQSIRSTVVEHINQFAWKVISAHPRHQFYITQSWINFTKTGEFHYRHWHTNSLISGSLYIQVKKDVDRICFYRNSPAQILVSDEQTNPYNAPCHCIGVDVGDLVLFPSALSHDVQRTTGAHTRISLAFNAFIKGEIGSEKRLNELVI